MDIKKFKVKVHLPISVHSSVVPNVVPTVVGHPNNNEQHVNDDTPNEETNSQTSERDESQEVALRRSQRERKSAIPSYYETYLQESDIGIDEDSVSFS